MTWTSAITRTDIEVAIESAFAELNARGVPQERIERYSLEIWSGRYIIYDDPVSLAEEQQTGWRLDAVSNLLCKAVAASIALLQEFETRSDAEFLIANHWRGLQTELLHKVELPRQRARKSRKPRLSTTVVNEVIKSDKVQWKLVLSALEDHKDVKRVDFGEETIHFMDGSRIKFSTLRNKLSIL